MFHINGNRQFNGIGNWCFLFNRNLDFLYLFTRIAEQPQRKHGKGQIVFTGNGVFHFIYLFGELIKGIFISPGTGIGTLSL